VHKAFALSSGKAALTLTLLALEKLTKRKKVIIPAYTCYSVPSSIVKAGLEVVPCDLAVGSFDYDYGRLGHLLGSDVLSVLSVHLFGVPSDTHRLKQLCRGTGVFVLEDAAQAFGCSAQGQPIGTIGDVGIFSLGRGKNITCGSGGVIVTNSVEIATSLTEIGRSIPTTTPAQDAAAGAMLLLLSLFIRPHLYWLPDGLPFLRLGETIFHESFPVRWLSDFQGRLLDAWQDRLAVLEAARRDHSRFYFSHLDAMKDCSSDVPQPARASTDTPFLRFPVILRTPTDKHHLLFELGGRALGMSGMYPATVAAIPQLGGLISEKNFPRAEAVAARLVTLPTHPLVSRGDRVRICALVNECVRRSHEPLMAS
jgi:dTDP-4-amino-4,6-dideoxygalactose transaminase